MSLAALNNRAFIYFIEAPAEKLIKIGRTCSLRQRFTDLCASNAGRLVLLGLQPCTSLEDSILLERQLHQRFASSCAHDKWFHSNKDVLDYIKNSAAPPESLISAPPAPLSQPPTLQPVAVMLEQYSPPVPLLNIKQLAERWKVSTATIRRQVHNGRLTCIQVGNQIRFDPSIIEGAGRD